MSTDQKTSNPVADTIVGLTKSADSKTIRVVTDESHEALAAQLGEVTTRSGVTSVTTNGVKVILGQKLNPNHPAGKKLPTYEVARKHISTGFERFVHTQNIRASITGVLSLIAAMVSFGLGHEAAWTIPLAGAITSATITAAFLVLATLAVVTIVRRNSAASTIRQETTNNVTVLDVHRKRKAAATTGKTDLRVPAVA